MTTNNQTDNPATPYNGQVTIYHANTKGTGAAARLELRIRPDRNGKGNCFFLEMARQKTPPSSANGNRTPATFDWAAKATVKLDFGDVCELLAVLEEKQEQAGGGRNGLYHAAGGANTIIAFRKNTERGGYSLGVSRKTQEGEQVFKGHILLSEPEGIGLRNVLQAGLFHMAFHASLAR